MAGRFSIEGIFKASDRLTRPIAKIQSQLGRFTRNASAGLKDLDRVSSKFFNGMKTGALVAGAAVIGAGAALASLAGPGMDFEQQITNVGAVSLLTRNQIAELEAKAKELGATTKFTATQAAEGMELMAKAGFTNQEIMQGIGGVLNAAAAEGAELAETAGHVSNVLKGMGLQTSEATRVADVLTLASARTNSSISSLGESMANVSSTARQFNIPLEDVVASVALLQDVGLDASVAGSAVNTMLTKLAAPTETIKKQMKQFGVTFQDAKGDMLPFAEVLENMAKAAEKSGGNMDQVAFFAELVGLRGQKAAANLKDLFKSGKVASLTKELQGATGSAEKMASLRMDTFKGDLLLLESATDAVKVELFDMQSGPLRGVVQGMTAWVGANKDLIKTKVASFIKSIADNIGAIMFWGSAILRFLAVLTLVATVIKAIAFAQALWNAAAMMNPYVLVAMAIIAAIALIIAFWPEIKAFFLMLWEHIKTIGSSIGEFFVGLWTSIVDTTKSIWGAITGFFSALWEGVKRPVVAAFEFIVGLAALAFMALKTIARPYIWFYSMLWEGVKAVFAFAWKIIVQVATGAFQLLKAAWAPISGFFSMLWGGVTAAFSTAWGLLVQAATAAYGVFTSIWSPIVGFFAGLWQGAVDAFHAVFDPIMAVINAVVAAIRAVGGAALGGGADAAEAEAGKQVSKMVSPQERVAKTINETTTTSKGEVTIKDTTGKAKITKKPKGNVGLRMAHSGAG